MSQDFSLTLHNSVKHGAGQLWNCTKQMSKTWKRSIRAIGGYWIGTAEYEGEQDEMLELFQEGTMREIREDVGGLITWQGYIAQMELTLDGVTFTRSMVDMYNAVKTIYSRIGDNLLTNGSAESGAWTAYNSATTSRVTSSEWATDGLYSCKIVVADTTVRGAYIQSSVTIVAEAAYDVQVKVNAVSGSWRIQVNRTDTGAPLAHDSTHGRTGEQVFRLSIPATNTYAGTVNFLITSEAAAGTIYGDGAYFQLAAVKAETNWSTSADSMSEYGRSENAILGVAMIKAQADALTATSLKKSAWPRIFGQNELSLLDLSNTISRPNKLSILFHGYVHTLANKYSIATGTANYDAQVRTIIGESEFITVGSISTNAVQFQIDNRAPIRHWQTLSDIANAGDASGNRWLCGVDAGRVFNYSMADNLVAYHYRGGKYYNNAGGELEPWFAEPGHLLYLDDAPIGPSQISNNPEDDLHVQYVAEVEMGPANDQFPNGSLIMRHEVAAT